MNRFKKYELYSKGGRTLEAFFDSRQSEGENTLTLKEEKDLLKLIYLQEHMLDPHSPEFRLCTFYAMKEGFNKDIDLQKYENDFSFFITDGIEKRSGSGWLSYYSGRRKR